MVARILQDGKTPAQWVDALAAMGVDVSERTLRERARSLGACRVLGKAMILLPEHIDLIFEEPEQCRSRNTSATVSGGSVEELQMVTDMSAEALEHLTRRSRPAKSATSKTRRAPKLSLVHTHRS